MRRAAALAVICLGVSGCGPRTALELSVRKVPANILLGIQQGTQQVIQLLVQPSPTPSRGPLAVGPLPTQAPLPAPTGVPSPTPPPPPPLPCPTAGPYSSPDEAAVPDLSGQPAPGTYSFRNQGVFTPNSNESAIKVAFPSSATHVVSPATAGTAPGTYTFDIADTAAGPDGRSRVTTTFLVEPNNPTGSAPGGVSVSQAAGIFITRVVTEAPGVAPTTFLPGSPVTYLNLPVFFGISWDTVGSDGSTTLKLHGAIDDSAGSRKGHRYVDACGTVIDTWEVVASGTLVSSSQNLALNWVYDVATQYGGMTFRQDLRQEGTQAALATNSISENTTTANRLQPLK
ncbi:MAG: hypothetical protein ACYDGR_05805 [Candidatus Dormibacteria bacterium]